MKYFKIFYLIILVIIIHDAKAQIGYYNAPYIRYEANTGTLTNATVTTKSYAQSNIQSEASEQICVNFSTSGASVAWTVSAEGDGLVVRYSVPDGESGIIDVYSDNVLVGTLNLTSYYSWEYLWSNGNPNNNGVSNTNPRMRFDEVRIKLSSKIPTGGILKLVRQSGNIHLDFAELELVPVAIPSSTGNVIYTGDGSTLQAVIDANGGKTIYLPAGVYYVNRELYFGVNNTALKGAGMWYTQIHFTNTGSFGGLRANASNITFTDLYLTTVRNSRSDSYNGINGVFTSGSSVSNIWTEHFECGAWIGQYNTGGPAYADGFTVSNCRFRNNYADGINLCKGTRNTIVEYCSFRNNGDDDMAIWSANGLECQNNTYRYNTSENCWRAAGIAIYGGYNNKAHNLLIRDNLEAGIRINNSFPGVGFNDNGMHQLYDITIQRCGTFNDLYYSPVGAIDIAVTNINGTRIKNVKFSNITITDSKNDAIYINRRNSGEGFYNLVFENISINGTGREFPDNNVNNLNWGRGYGILFVGNPSGYGTYCNITYANRGGNAQSNINSGQIGTFTWTQDCSAPSATSITSGTTFGICTSPITFEATATAPGGNTINYIEFFVDNVSIGQDNTSAYSMEWNNPTVGSHQVKAVAYFSGGTNSPSAIQNIMVEDGIYNTSVSPVIDGNIDALWSNHSSFNLNIISQGSVSSSADLSAYFKAARDASNLYILVDVTDDILRNDGTASWQKDGVELYIDMGNDKTGTYVANNDFQYSFIYGISTAQAGLTFAQTTKPGNLGYILEIRIPWTTLGGVPLNGTLMGFDLHVEDNDTGTRNGKKAWRDAADNAWQSTSVLGALQIASCSNPLLALDNNAFYGKDKVFNFYPNPFNTNGNLSFTSSSNSNYTISIHDINGKSVYQETMTGNGPYSIGESLPAGIYILEVNDGISKGVVKLIKF